MIYLVRAGFVLLVLSMLCSCSHTQMATEADKKLVAELEEAIEAAKDTPAREASLWITGGWPGKLIPIMKGEKPGTEKQFNQARWAFKTKRDELRKGPDFPKPKQMTLPYTKTAPKLDGMLDDAAWKSAFRSDKSYKFGSTEALPGANTVWYAMWDETYLYFAFDCKDSDIYAPDMPRDDHVYFHDCVELFIMPEKRTRVYWEIVVSPSKSVFDGLHAKLLNNWGANPNAPENVDGLKIGTSIKGTRDKPDDTDTGYIVEIAVPFDQLPSYTRGNAPKPGELINFVMIRLDKNAKGMDVLAFIPLMSWGHNIWNHVPVVLGKKK